MTRSSTPDSPRWGYALLLRLHFYAGLLVGPFIFVAALSGALYALTPQVENWLYQTELTTDAPGEPLPLAEQIHAAREYIGPEATLAAVRPAPSIGETTRVMFSVPDLPPYEHQSIFIDPATLEVRGSLAVYGTSGSLPLRIWIDYLHRQLHLGELGRYYSELAASWLWLVALGGLVLWWKSRRTGNRSASSKQRLRRWHSNLGVIILLALLFFSVTGLTWSKWAGGNIAELRAWLDWGTPGLDTRLTGPGSGAHAHHGDHEAGHTGANPLDAGATYDRVLQQARAAGIDAGKVEIKPGVAGSKAWMVREIDRSWPTQVDSVAIEPDTFAVTDKVEFETFPIAAKLTRWGIDAHMGILFGLPNQLLVAGCALALCVLIVLGYRMWWSRRPTRSGEGQRLWHRIVKVPPLALPGIALVALALGVFAPVMGVSLLVFLVVDGLLALRHHRRALAMESAS